MGENDRSYYAGYTLGYLEGLGIGQEIGYRSCVRAYKKQERQEKEEKRRQLYFFKQKVIGVFLFVMAFLFAMLLDGDITISILILPVSFMLIFGREKILVDRYVWKGESDESNQESGT